MDGIRTPSQRDSTFTIELTPFNVVSTKLNRRLPGINPVGSDTTFTSHIGREKVLLTSFPHHSSDDRQEKGQEKRKEREINNVLSFDSLFRMSMI